MGSPSARLKTRESLRPWLESGLEFFYHPGGQNISQPVVEQAVQQTAAPSPASRPSHTGQKPQQATTNTVQSPQSQNMRTRQQQAQQPQQQAAQPAANFAGPWADFLKHAKPEAKIVFTYMELGLDLGGQSDPQRRAVLKNFQAHLRWPAGTINFWPPAALVAGALQPDGRMFWQGWEQWRTPYIACFGTEALRVILPDADTSLKTHILEHVTIYVLPPLSKLIGQLPHEQQMAVDILANLRF